MTTTTTAPAMSARCRAKGKNPSSQAPRSALSKVLAGCSAGGEALQTPHHHVSSIKTTHRFTGNLGSYHAVSEWTSEEPFPQQPAEENRGDSVLMNSDLKCVERKPN